MRIYQLLPNKFVILFKGYIISCYTYNYTEKYVIDSNSLNNIKSKLEYFE